MDKCGFSKTKSGFGYYGKLEDCILKAKEKVARLENETPYIERRFEEEKRRRQRHLNSINDTYRFIACAENELMKQEILE